MSSSKHTKIKERQLLADRIERNGIPMPSCANCLRNGRSCIVAPGHRRCSECTRRNSKCDACAPSAAEWEKLRVEEERLEAEEEAAAAQEQEAYARRMRLRKQQKALKLRGAEMLRRGLRTLDELDEAEEKDRLEAEARDALLPSPPTTTSGPATSPHDLFPDVDPSVFSPGYWATWGADASTPGATHG
ncbi:hypothetical protein VE04_10208 [Pseudogymnoascus sp. 24MN13]|nr:hypothetical protein VE04_10208 [Pseudogymnoascus sp. 24MN13]